MEDRIKALVKELFDEGMTLDEIIEMVSSIATQEDMKRFAEGLHDEEA